MSARILPVWSRCASCSRCSRRPRPRGRANPSSTCTSTPGAWTCRPARPPVRATKTSCCRQWIRPRASTRRCWANANGRCWPRPAMMRCATKPLPRCAACMSCARSRTVRWPTSQPGARLRPGFLPGVDFATKQGHTVEELRALHDAGQLQVFAEVSTQYRGIRADDPRYEPFFALAEELDIPIGIHLGEGPPGAAGFPGYEDYRASLTTPFQLEDVLRRHPKLRIYVMHYGSPLVDEMIAIGTLPRWAVGPASKWSRATPIGRRSVRVAPRAGSMTSFCHRQKTRNTCGLSDSQCKALKFLPPRMVAGEGIEPPTRGFSIPCSTN